MTLRLPSFLRPGFHPSARAVLLLVGAAPLALLIAVLAPGVWPDAWIAAPALGGALLLLVLLDAAFAGRLADVRVIAPDEVEVGHGVVVRVFADLTGVGAEAVLALDPRLTHGGRTALTLASQDGALQGSATIVPNRRGTGSIDGVWLRWQGPLGLAQRLAFRPIDLSIRVRPDVSPLRSPALQLFLRDADIGHVARRIRGEGAEFEALADYEPGMDRRRIDWKSSARHAALVAREYEIERNNQIVFALDCGQAMCEPIAGLARIDRAVTAALTTAWVALKAQDRVALFGFAARPLLATPFVAHPRDFHRLQEAAASLDYHAEEANFTLALTTLSSRLKRRSLVVVFSEFTDPTSAGLMLENVGRLIEKHVVLFVVMDDADLTGLAQGPVADIQDVAMAVTATALLRQRQIVLQRLRHMGVRVVEAGHEAIGLKLLDAYLSAKRQGVVG